MLKNVRISRSHATTVATWIQNKYERAVLPAKSDSDVIFCSQSLSKLFNCNLHLI